MATIRERAESVHLDPERLAEHASKGWLQLDGEVVTDIDADTPDGSRIVIVPTRET